MESVMAETRDDGEQHLRICEIVDSRKEFWWGEKTQMCYKRIGRNIASLLGILKDDVSPAIGRLFLEGYKERTTIGNLIEVLLKPRLPTPAQLIRSLNFSPACPAHFKTGIPRWIVMCAKR
eukprot:408831_1